MSCAVKRGNEHLFESGNLFPSPLSCAKRSRYVPDAKSRTNSPRQQTFNLATPFVPRTIATPIEIIISPLKRRKDKIEACGVCGTAKPCPQFFTALQVQQMVQRAVGEREAQLRSEFDSVLLEKMADQCAQLSEMNEASIHKQLAESQYSYMS